MSVQAPPQPICQHDVFVQNLVTWGGLQSCQALLLLTNCATEKCVLCKFGSLEIVCLEGHCAGGQVRDHPVDRRQMILFKRLKEPGTGKPPSVHCFRKGGTWVSTPLLHLAQSSGLGLPSAYSVLYKSLLFSFLQRKSHTLSEFLKESPAKAKTKAGVNAREWPMRTAIISIPDELVLQEPPYHEAAGYSGLFCWLSRKEGCVEKTLVHGYSCP